MAHRETLKELQSRLTQRFHLARSSNIAMTWLAAVAGSKNYLIPLRHSGEILPAPQLRPVPRTKDWFLGVVNVRGSLYGTVDLAQFVADFSFREGNAAIETAAYGPNAPTVITFHTALEVNCALQVSALAGLRSADSFASSMPAPAGAPVYFGDQYLDAESIGWQVIDIQELSQTLEFLNISA